MVGSRDAIAEWARVTYGGMGRAPDYKAAFFATLGANPDFYKPFDANARRWYKRSTRKVTFVNHENIRTEVITIAGHDGATRSAWPNTT